MEFKLRVVSENPTRGDLVLEPEDKLSGLKFISAFSAVTRKSVDTIDRYKHNTLGALSMYEMNVPQALAVESGLYEEAVVSYVTVSNDFLKNFIFYIASADNIASRKPCYPYMTSEAILTSQIDELTFLYVWKYLGYPNKMVWKDGQAVAAEVDDSDSEEDSGRNPGQGCDGCPARPYPYPDGRPAGWIPPSPPGPYYPPYPPYYPPKPDPKPQPRPEPEPYPDPPRPDPKPEPPKPPKIDPLDPPAGTIAIGDWVIPPIPGTNLPFMD